MTQRIIIVGGPRTGKTTLAGELGIEPVLHTDDLIGTHSWEDVPDAVCEWMRAPGPWVIEGVQTARALRRFVRDRGELPPVDQIIVLAHPHVELSKRQEAMTKGVMKIWREVEPLLVSVVDVVYG